MLKEITPEICSICINSLLYPGIPPTYPCQIGVNQEDVNELEKQKEPHTPPKDICASFGDLIPLEILGDTSL